MFFGRLNDTLDSVSVFFKPHYPWWQGFLEFFILEKSGKSIKTNLTNNIMHLVGDAKKISILQRLMPASVKKKYQKDLIDDNRAIDYLFEIRTAWHFFLNGCKIKWHENDSKKHSEFLVKDTNFEFNVECKRISVDISRKIRRRDFYRFIERLIPRIQKIGFSGSIDISLNDRLHSNDKYLNDLSTQILDIVESGALNGTHQIQFGSVNIDLHKTNGTIIDFHKHFRSLMERKEQNAQGAIFAHSKNNQPSDPMEITIISEKADNVLEAIKDRIYNAAIKQLDVSQPGLICCYLEGIDHLTDLAQNSGLQAMTS